MKTFLKDSTSLWLNLDSRLNLLLQKSGIVNWKKKIIVKFHCISANVVCDVPKKLNTRMQLFLNHFSYFFFRLAVPKVKYFELSVIHNLRLFHVSLKYVQLYLKHVQFILKNVLLNLKYLQLNLIHIKLSLKQVQVYLKYVQINFRSVWLICVFRTFWFN